MVVKMGSGLRARVMRRVIARRGMPDVTTLRRLPASATYPLRRHGVDPVPQLGRTRDSAPVARLTKIFGTAVWLVSGFDEARAVLADSTRFSNDMRHVIGSRSRTDAESIGGLGMTDAPDHTLLRGILTPEFTRRRLTRLDSMIDTIVTETLDDLAAKGPVVDLVPHFGFEVPFRVICELLGLTDSDRRQFQELGIARFDLSQGGVGVFGAATESRTFLIDAVARQRAEPGDGLIGAIIASHGDELDDVALGGLVDGVFLGGYETSASMLGMGVYVLSENPEIYARLREGDDAEVDRIIEELLRYLCPVQLAFPRFAREDMDLFGQQISAGDVVVVSLSGANRDPRTVPEPEQFSLANAGTAHLAFGHGMHRCVGAELSRMELRSALVGLATRFPDLALVPGADLAFRELSMVHSLDSLPVDLGQPPTAG